MFEFLQKALEVLAPAGWIVQGSFVLLVVFVGYLLLRRADRDRESGRGGASVVSPPQSHEIPSWALYGPVHEVMQTVHDMAEEHRKSNVMLDHANSLAADTTRLLTSLDKGQEYTHKLLEEILRNQELRPDYAAVGAPTRRIK